MDVRGSHGRKGVVRGVGGVGFPRNAPARRGWRRLDTLARDFASNYVIKTPPAVLGVY